jgi:hypothetical protein
MISKTATLTFLKALETLDPGVLDYWSIEKSHQTVSRYSGTPKSIQIEYAHLRLLSSGS